MLYGQPHIACHECDALLATVAVPPGKKLVCPRCRCTLRKPARDPIDRGLALSLTSLTLMVPAFFMPIMTFNMLGLDTVDTMVKGVLHLFQAGFWWMALLVMFCSIVAPMLQNALVLLICLLVRAGRYGGLLVLLLKSQSRIGRWAMLEVYMLSILVAYIKMIDSGQVHMGVGMICFSGMMLSTTLNAVMFDTHPIWEKVGQTRGGLHENRPL
ncbi:MAG: paraquat-inducible membrane protein A [Pseudomonadales bacterium]|nr:paraquat-inducible membrane protein A [Pseudomonadales bacterium]MCK5790235.1 paraquat-inducible protein A [Ketobacter sp.]MEC8812472.1 paraquat-inducible protein A [Pseudomonadota bacterium]TNC89782.1 MAG: paraquat-inducible membrane protein A [Alcanivorax sp.]HAG94189.1 paraquat-inducible protein A [Gammaproteobacteria bacterium]|tara:strand:- start:28765 stop:29403 length:639 start_codon:yes stop_codon:yes gene_type:complete